MIRLALLIRQFVFVLLLFFVSKVSLASTDGKGILDLDRLQFPLEFKQVTVKLENQNQLYPLTVPTKKSGILEVTATSCQNILDFSNGSLNGSQFNFSLSNLVSCARLDGEISETVKVPIFDTGVKLVEAKLFGITIKTDLPTKLKVRTETQKKVIRKFDPVHNVAFSIWNAEGPTQFEFPILEELDFKVSGYRNGGLVLKLSETGNGNRALLESISNQLAEKVNTQISRATLVDKGFLFTPLMDVLHPLFGGRESLENMLLEMAVISQATDLRASVVQFVNTILGTAEFFLYVPQLIPALQEIPAENWIFKRTITPEDGVVWLLEYQEPVALSEASASL